MARARYTCPVCGRTVDVVGATGRDAKSKAEWHERNGTPCWDCRRKQEQEAAKAAAVELGLPALEGTPKQAAWAERIRADALGSQLAAQAEPYAAWLKVETSAKVFIDHRDHLYKYWRTCALLDLVAEVAADDIDIKAVMLIELSGTVSITLEDKALAARFSEVKGDLDLWEWEAGKTVQERRALWKKAKKLISDYKEGLV